MKTLAYYSKLNYKMVITEDKEEGGFIISYPELPGCITCGETRESAILNSLDAKKEWLKAAIEENVEIFEPAALQKKGFKHLKIKKYQQVSSFIQSSLSCLSSFKK